jgi:putative ABC transport system permease protein
MKLLPLALRSLWNRRSTAILTVLSIAISVALLLSVRQMSTQAQTAFTNTISGTDLVVGARSGQVNLLLYSVFRLGDATNNISWSLYEKMAHQRDVAWAIPISLGDSHRGFRVLGTTEEYFRHYHYAGDRALQFAAGHSMQDLFDVVLGAEVARKLGYRLGDKIVLSHGVSTVSLVQHGDKPFVVTGILRPTGTPVDRTVHVSLAAIEAIHIDWQSGMQAPEGARVSAEEARTRDLTPKTVTAIFLGLKSKFSTFDLQRSINEYRGEPLLAILPGVALQQLWSVVSVVETILTAVGEIAVVAGLLCLLTAILTSLNERRREMAILRSVGARPAHVFLLFMSEAALLAVVGVIAGIVINQLALLIARPIMQQRYGLLLERWAWSITDLLVLALVLAAALLIGAIPAWQAYRRTLADGLIMRI